MRQTEEDKPLEIAEDAPLAGKTILFTGSLQTMRSEEHTSELQSPCNLVCRLLLEKKNTKRLRKTQ